MEQQDGHPRILDSHSVFRDPKLVCQNDNLLFLAYNDPAVGEFGSSLKYYQVIEAIDEGQVGSEEFDAIVHGYATGTDSRKAYALLG
ncbi:MAG: hypothetical protein MMC33_000739 [Icmadophila ericetorum]|nr:hypothetical protein [Icmadophila ericetorum]